MIRFTISEEEHRRMNEFRNHVMVWSGFAMIVALAVAGVMFFVGAMWRLVGLVW